MSALSFFFFYSYADHRDLHSFPTRRSSDLRRMRSPSAAPSSPIPIWSNGCAPAPRSTTTSWLPGTARAPKAMSIIRLRSEEHTSELQSHSDLVCRLLLEKKKKKKKRNAQNI